MASKSAVQEIEGNKPVLGEEAQHVQQVYLDYKERRRLEIELHQQKKGAENTFQPVILPSKVIGESRPLYTERKLVDERTGSPQLSPREMVTLKREAEAKKERDNYSFQPKINGHSGTKTLGGEGAVSSESTALSKFDQLYEDAISKKINEKAYQEKHRPSFTPTLHSRSASRDRVSASSVEKLYGSPGAGRARDPADIRDRDKKKKEDFFSPKITRRASTTERTFDSVAEKKMSTAERLYEAAKALTVKRKELSQKVPEQCTFAPTFASSEKKRMSVSAEEGAGNDLLSRSASFLTQRQKRLETLQQNSAPSEATFKPTMHTSSYVPPPPSSDGSSAVNRRKSSVKETESFSFQPTINKTYHVTVRGLRPPHFTSFCLSQYDPIL